MTFREKFAKDYPDASAFSGCPVHYGYENDWDCTKISITCETCWNRVISEDPNRILLHTLLDTVLDVQESGDYAAIDISNHGNSIMVYHMVSGFQEDKNFDYSTFCSIDDTEALQEIIDYFKSILERKRK